MPSLPRIPSFGRPAKLSNNKHQTSPIVEPTSLQQVSSEKRPSITAMDLLHFAKDKRKSLSDRPPSRKASPKPTVPKKASIHVNIESPPLVFYGCTTGSTGALLGGQLQLEIVEPDLTLQSFSMKLICKATVKKPVSKDCSECAVRSKEVFEWDFLSEPMNFTKGCHSFPFSYLLPGDLPQETFSQLGSIGYSLHATAKTSTSDTINHIIPLSVKRALNPPSFNRTSLRIFPPTYLKVELVHPPVIHPIGEFTCQFRMICISHKGPSAHFRWKLRRLSWEIREITKMISPACAKHSHKIGGENKGIEHTDTRTIGHGELKNGWKTDFYVAPPPTVDSAPDPPSDTETKGMTEMDFNCSIKPNSHTACDINNGAYKLSVTHVLALEMIVLEEVSSKVNPTPKSYSATGTARVLRTQHQVILTERLGLGVSWDEEQPPMYEDVPASPPRYATSTIEDYTGEDLGVDQGMEDLNLER